MTITTDQLTQFRALLKNEEKSAATLNKYLRDVQRFALWLGDTPLERDAMLDYKADLMRHYAAGSVNSILAALNRFLRMIAREDCRVHRLRIQYQAYSPEEREITAQEYADLVRTARETGRARRPGAAADLHHRHRAHHLRCCVRKLRQDHDQRPADPCRGHPAQPAGLPHRLWRG